MSAGKMRTQRRFAHEEFSEPGEYEVRPIEVDLPYLYARWAGLRTNGTGWFDLFPGGAEKGTEDHSIRAQYSMARILNYIDAGRAALTADALYQGMTGQEAYQWIEERLHEDMEMVWERAVHWGVDPEAIKPYPCGLEPDHHDHRDGPAPGGGHFIKRVAGKESECVACCEPLDGEPLDTEVDQ